MNLSYGISTMVFYHERIEKLLPYLADKKMKNIEIRPRTGHFECQNPESLDQLKRKIDHYGIKVKAIHMPMADVDISHPEEYDRVRSVREVEKTMLTAFRLGAELVVVHPGRKCDQSEDRKKRLQYCISSLTEIVEFGQSWNMKIALENTLPGRLGDQWEEMQQIISSISSAYLGFCLDAGHYLLSQRYYGKEELNLEKEPIHWYRDLFHVHMQDNDGEQDLHLLPWEGDFPWDELIFFLRKIKYHGSIIIEPKHQKHLPTYLDKINQVIEKCQRVEC